MDSEELKNLKQKLEKEGEEKVKQLISCFLEKRNEQESLTDSSSGRSWMKLKLFDLTSQKSCK
jgi:hypothetical protein